MKTCVTLHVCMWLQGLFNIIWNLMYLIKIPQVSSVCDVSVCDPNTLSHTTGRDTTLNHQTTPKYKGINYGLIVICTHTETSWDVINLS